MPTAHAIIAAPGHGTMQPLSFSGVQYTHVYVKVLLSCEIKHQLKLKIPVQERG